MPDSPLNKYSQIAVVAHDAGGAEIVSSYIKKFGLKEKCRYSLQGPAIEIFFNKLGFIDNEDEEIDKILSKCDCLFSSTSWGSSHEYDAIKKANALGIRTIAFLDHWVNYEQRFIRNHEQILPQEIWVSDEYALEIAQYTFGGKVQSILAIENPYLAEAARLLDEANNKNVASTLQITGFTALFLSEAISEHALKVHGDERYWGYTQLEAFQYLMENIDALRLSLKTIRIRPHPSESRDKFLGVLNQFPIRVELSANTSLWEDIAWSDIVFGCNSMAMVASLESNKRVICVIPPDGGACKLPHKKIESLSLMIDSRR
jgi:hypothetical protein